MTNKLLIIFVILSLCVLLIFVLYQIGIPKKISSQNYSNKQFGFSLQYPIQWQVLSQTLNGEFHQFIFISNLYDLDGYYLYGAKDGYFEINVTPTSYWFELDENKKRKYTSALEMFPFIEEERKVVQKIPGPPAYRSTPKDPFISGLVEVQSVRTYENSSYQYWVVRNQYVYEIFIQYPTNPNIKFEFENSTRMLMKSFRINTL